jgi:hypothetical protein
MEERELRSRVTWIVGIVLATAFVATIVWSVAQDADDDGPRLVSEEDLDGTTSTFDEVGEPIDPDVSIVIPEELRPDEPLDDGFYTLTVHDDGCGVIRTERPEDLDGLTWVFKDLDGFQVLGRNALGEDRYRYFQSGRYTVVLEAYGAGSYEEVSNTVTVTC